MIPRVFIFIVLILSGCYQVPELFPKQTAEKCCAVCKGVGSVAQRMDERTCWCADGSLHFAGEVPVECSR